MSDFIKIIFDSYTGYFNYLISEISNPGLTNYFYWLTGLSLAVWLLELAFPWRKNQSAFRKDFWLDLFYVFFNYFLFSLIAYNALSNVGVELFNRFLGLFGIENMVALSIASWPVWLRFLTFFLIADFIQWWVHRMLHRVPALWEFHKVHHSVQEMGFAAHLRFHPMETIIYKTIQFVFLSMIGFGILDLFWLHTFTLAIGHLNHANIRLDYGPLKYLLNNPLMHIWHHAKDIGPHKYGVNFGITLSLWDYIFRTNYIPFEGRDIELGFEKVETYPDGFLQQILEPVRGKTVNR